MESDVVAGRVFEHEGLLWKRRLGAQSTFEGFAAARIFFMQTNEAAPWNPWLRDDNEEELEWLFAFDGVVGVRAAVAG